MRTTVQPASQRLNRTFRVLVFQCEDGDYTACERCLEKVGQLKDRGAPDEEITALIRSFKDKE